MKADIDTLLDAYISAWDSMDFDTLQSFWHADEDEIYYLAEEAEQPYYRLSEVIKYWEFTKSIIDWLSVTAANRHIKPLTEELCVLSYDMHVDIGMTGSPAMKPKPVGVDIRVSAILRKTVKGWRFIHYAEAPLGALPYVRSVYNANVRIEK